MNDKVVSYDLPLSAPPSQIISTPSLQWRGDAINSCLLAFGRLRRLFRRHNGEQMQVLTKQNPKLRIKPIDNFMAKISKPWPKR